MELKEFLHMKAGNGELSYSQNSFLQKGVSSMSRSTLEKVIQSLVSKRDGSPLTVLKVADLGCGVGPVPLALASLLIENVQSKCKEMNNRDDDDQVPEIQIYFNDLLSNDFNLLFRDLMSLEVLENKKDGMPLCYLMGAPGSYYGRLFPNNTLNLVHANYTLHWLSQAPQGLYNHEGKSINKGNIYISEASPRSVAKAYLDQFGQDMTQFLKCRSKEVVPDGLMLLTFRGRPSSSDAETWQPWEIQIMAQAISSLVSQGLIKEEKLESFDFPYYGACKEEIQGIVEKEGSFKIENIETVVHPVAYEIEDNRKRADAIGKFMRAFSEPLFSSHFGHQVMDPLYDKLTLLVYEHLANHQPADHFTIIILLKRN